MASTSSRNLVPTAPEAPDADGGFSALAERLRSIARRATLEGWHGWSDADTRAIAAAALELETIPDALSEGMREAFAIGREYGHGEEHLRRLNWEIGAAASRLARQAWGRSRDDRGPDESGSGSA